MKLGIIELHDSYDFDSPIALKQLVRCCECKHWDDRRKDAWWSEEGACYLTSRLGYATYRNHDDFCSYGERKVSEKPTGSEKPNNSKERSSE